MSIPTDWMLSALKALHTSPCPAKNSRKVRSCKKQSGGGPALYTGQGAAFKIVVVYDMVQHEVWGCICAEFWFYHKGICSPVWFSTCMEFIQLNGSSLNSGKFWPNATRRHIQINASAFPPNLASVEWHVNAMQTQIGNNLYVFWVICILCRESSWGFPARCWNNYSRLFGDVAGCKSW